MGEVVGGDALEARGGEEGHFGLVVVVAGLVGGFGDSR